MGKENVASKKLIKICRKIAIDVIKQLKANEMEVTIKTLVETLLNKAKKEKRLL